MRILLTGVGAPGTPGTIKMLRENPAKEKVFIYGIDATNVHVGRHLCDSFQRVAYPEDATYVHVLQGICEASKINIVIPQTTRETVILSKYRSSFERIGVAVAVVDSEYVEKFNNKYYLLKICPYAYRPINFLSTNADEFNRALSFMQDRYDKVVVKPPVGNGSRGVRIIDEPDYSAYLNDKPNSMRISTKQFRDILNQAPEWPELLLMEYLPGAEWTVDVINTPQNRLIIPRIRNRVKSGISDITQIIDSKEIKECLNELLDAYPMYGVFGFQFKQDADCVPMMLECNPRIQGTMAATYAAGVNIVWAAVEYALYGELKTRVRKKIPSITYYRLSDGYVDKAKKLSVTIKQ